MLLPGLIFAYDALMETMAYDQAIEQVANVASLPGIIGHSIAMPDIHWGYGFPIGGIAAMDVDTGVISPGGVGYDINCGVRLALTPDPYTHLNQRTRDALLRAIFDRIPSGVGF